MTTCNRRQFVQQSMAAVVGAGTLSSAMLGAETEESFPIIDTHQHLWDISKFKLPWLESASEAIKRSFVTKDYIEATRGLQMKAVYMEVNVDPSQKVLEAEHVIELSKSADHPTIAAVIGGIPTSEEFKDYAMRFKGNPYVKGVRRVLHDPDVKAGTCLSEIFVKNMRLLGELGMSFDLCMRPNELMDGVKLADQCPDTRFIVDHCGNADPKAFGAEGEKGIDEAWHKAEPWKKAIAELAKRKNVICKISGVVVRAPQGKWNSEQLAPIVNHCLDEFGAERVVFGSDWPVCLLNAQLRDWVAALKEITSERGRDYQRKLFHDNAERLYKLT